MNKKELIAIGSAAFAIAALTACGSIAGSSSGGSTTGYTAPTSGPTATATPPPATPQYTVPQQQAIQAAEQYLSMDQGFSREGLIQQLDSSAGDGFSKSLARFAVNHIKVNWDHQAALAAKGYMSMGGFSYSGMVQQLESSAGDGFTHAQAVYGAKSVGL